MPPGNIRYKRIGGFRSRSHNWPRKNTFLSGLIGFPDFGTMVVHVGQEFHVMHVLNNPLFWNKKLKIAILALATFIAMC